MPKGALDGVRVVELAIWVATPGGGAILGDWGADVIKVENVKGGDPLRGFRSVHNVEVGDVNFWWELNNRNKRSIALDIDKPQGRAVLLKLVEKADVFLTNILPDGLAKRGLDYKSLAEVNPRLVYLSFTGLGDVGPDAKKAGYDITVFWARSGFMQRLAEPGRVPPAMPAAVGDQTSAMFIAGAVSAALFARERTGQGQKIDLSLYGVASWTLGWEIQAALSTGTEIKYQCQDEAKNPLWNIYETGDGRWLQLACIDSDRYWDAFCLAVGRMDLKADERFQSHLAREENYPALIPIIKDAFRQKTLAEWGEILTAHRIVFEKAQSFTEMVEDRQAIENGFFVEVQHSVHGSLKLVSSPVKFSTTPSAIRALAPAYAQHSEAILIEHGYTLEESTELIVSGAVY